MKRIFTLPTVAATVAATCLAVGAGTGSASGPGGGPQFSLPPANPAALKTLTERAAERGTVPVIVALAVPTRAPHELPAAEEAAQRRAIGHARGNLVAELKGEALHGLKISDDMPLIAFDATPGQLQRLARSRHVAAVTEDRELEVELAVASGTDGRVPGQPDDRPTAPTTEGATTGATSSNGSSNQLAYWWDRNRIGVPQAISAGYTGAGQTVAVLDTGVDRNHGWLSGRVVAEACFSTVAGSIGNCPNGSNVQYGAGAAAPCAYDASACAHGTHVAHTAAGYWGVASGAKIVAVQVFHRGPNGKAVVWESDLVWGMSYVYSLRNTYRIAAVNLSIWNSAAHYPGYCDNTGMDGSVNATYLTGWVNALRNAGIASVIISGNGNSSTGISQPGCISGATSVGNTTLDAAGYDAVYGYVSNGSNSNATLDLLAPGTDICSAVPVWLDADRDGMDCGYIGTSMAAPHVAGAMAVLRQLRPYATVSQLESALRLSGPGVYDSRNGVTRTRINVYTALSKI